MQIYNGVKELKAKINSNLALEGVPKLTSEQLISSTEPRLEFSVDGLKSSVVTIGNFDGVHLGHQQLIENVVREAQYLGAPAVVVTFDPHPLKVLSMQSLKIKGVERLFDLRDQQEQFEARGINIAVVEPFTVDFAKVTAEEFLDQFIVKHLNPKTLVVGHDFTFGARRQGTLAYLEEYCAEKCIKLIIIPPFHFKNIIVSSTKIREALAAGQVEQANELLGRNYYLRGHVQKGFQRGRLIGVPTAYIHPEVEFMPRKGVYVTLTKFAGQTHRSITNIGVNPTFHEGDLSQFPLKIESHIFNFEGQIYGIEVEVILLHFLRDEQKFNGIDQLVVQIKSDLLAAESYFDESD
jgi:riboflavin kinase/FMN adenylyltransferase